MYNIPRFQTGKYIPGLQSSIFGAKLDRSVADTQEDLRNKAKRMQKGLFRGKIGKFLGKGAGKWLGKALTTGIAATNPLAALALSSAISAGTQRIGEKIGRGKDVNLRNTSGLLGSQYDDLRDYQKGAEKASKGAAWDTFGEEIIGGLKSDYGKQIWGDQLSDDFKTKVFGKNLGSKTHDELSKMNIGEMLGTKGAFFGAEDKLSDVGLKMYEGAGDLYDSASKGYGNFKQNLGQSMMDKFNQAKSASMQTDYSSLTPEQSQIQYDDMYQDGGIVGYQEGGIRRAPDKDLSPELQNYIRLALTTKDDPIYQDKKDLENEYYTGAAGSYDIVDHPERKAYKKFIQEGKGNARDDMYLRRFSNLRNELQRNFDKDLVGLDNLNFLAEKGYSIDEEDRKAPLDRAISSRDKIDDTLLNMYVSDSFKPAMQEAGIHGYQYGGMAYPLQMAGGGYMPEQGIGGLIQHRKGY
jgi:hypothetical protein